MKTRQHLPERMTNFALMDSELTDEELDKRFMDNLNDMERRKKVYDFLDEMSSQRRVYWCTAASCACNGCLQNDSTANKQFPYPDHILPEEYIGWLQSKVRVND